MTQATADELLALAERVEQATGPDREIDLAIFGALDMPLPEKYADMLVSLAWNEDQRAFIYQLGDMQVRYEPAPYTASLDAALSLVPEGHRWLVDKRPFAEGRSDGYRAQVYREGYYYKSDMSDTPTSWAASPATALTAAALRARAHSQEVK